MIRDEWDAADVWCSTVLYVHCKKFNGYYCNCWSGFSTWFAIFKRPYFIPGHLQLSKLPALYCRLRNPLVSTAWGQNCRVESEPFEVSSKNFRQICLTCVNDDSNTIGMWYNSLTMLLLYFYIHIIKYNHYQHLFYLLLWIIFILYQLSSSHW